jgi:predicted transcriptional regulator
MIVATKPTKDTAEAQIEQRLQGIRAGSIRALLTLAAFPEGDVSATELTEKLGQHRSTTTNQLSELADLGVVTKKQDPTTANRTNPTLLYTLNPEVDLIQLCNLFIEDFPLECQAAIDTIQAKSNGKPEVAHQLDLPVPEEFEGKIAALVTSLARKIVDLTERVVELESSQENQTSKVLPPDLSEAFKMLQ